MKKNRKILAVAGAAVLVIAIGTASVLGVSAHAKNTAKETALKYLPADAQLVAQETEDDRYEFKFHSAERKEKYEIEIGKKTKELAEWKSQADASDGSKSVKLTQQDVEKIVSDELSSAKVDGAKMTKTQLVEEDGFQVYEVAFQSSKCRGSYDIHPESGLILEREIKIGAPIVIPLTSTPAEGAAGATAGSTQQDGAILSVEKARELALKEVPGAAVTDIDLELEKGIYVYQIELYQGGYEYDLVLNAKDGARISLKSEKDDWDENGGWVHHTGRNPVTTEQTQAKAQEKPTQQNGASSYIGVAKAKEIVLQKVPGATITKIELERDDGRVAYEGEAQKGKVEYEFDIDAYTGAILSWEEEQSHHSGSGTQPAGKVIGIKQVKAILEKKMPGAIIVDLDMDPVNGRLLYEGEVRKSGTEYDFEIDATTGTILKWEAEPADRD